VQGIEIGTFQEVSGLAVDVEVEELQEGGENQFVHKLPGRMSWPNVVLKRGITKSDNLFAWLAKSSGTGYAGNSNQLERRTATVTLLAPDGTRLRHWEMVDSFAVKWTGPSFDATSTDPATEQLEIAHHGFQPGTT
jgi:phage tail-like protein